MLFDFNAQLVHLASMTSATARNSFAEQEHDVGLRGAFGAAYIEDARHHKVDGHIAVAISRLGGLKVTFLAYCFPLPEHMSYFDDKNLTLGIVLIGQKAGDA